MSYLLEPFQTHCIPDCCGLSCYDVSYASLLSWARIVGREEVEGAIEELMHVDTFASLVTDFIDTPANVSTDEEGIKTFIDDIVRSLRLILEKEKITSPSGSSIDASKNNSGDNNNVSS
eukprot:TRINITY_DN34968_c0_g1_i1.p1 TRINITY_DN34968_c0_g1~~TRINITY_DN34968_c0_g1_i1.p1  ORF type:complete len:126 (+),score=12.00 TRINITY_DN34968_c0_g1_i1:24-380(+)